MLKLYKTIALHKLTMLGNNSIQVLHCGIYCAMIRDNYITGYKCVYINVQVNVFIPTLFDL